MRTRTVVAAALLAAMAVPLGACRRALAPSIIVYGRGEDAESLDPQGIDDGESAKVVNNLFESLVTFGPGNADVVPCLAESWTTSPDGLEWTFRLRPNVKFHDGTPMDSAAVLFSFERLLVEKSPSAPPEKVPYASFYRDAILAVVPKGPDAVLFKLRRPYAPFLANLAMFAASIVSPAAVNSSGPKAFGQAPVGTGPYRLESWARGEKKIVLVGNPAYWGEPPAVPKVVFRTIPDKNSRLTALRAGDINWLDTINPEDLEPCRRDPRLKVWSATGMNVGYLAMNTERKPFDDVRVRRAVSLAVDRKKLLDTLYYGAGTPAVHPMPPAVPGYDASVPLPAADPAAAKALLAQAGFPEGFETDLYAMPNDRPYFPSPLKIAEVLKADLATAGIRVKITTPGDFSLYREALSNGRHSLGMLGWTGDNGDPDNFLYTFFAKENAVKGAGALNISFWVDPRMQDLLRQGQEEFEPAKRAAIYARALALVREEVPLVPIAHADAVFVSRAGFEGFHVQPTGDLILRVVKPPAE